MSHETENRKFVVFMTVDGKYIAVRTVYLAFGNTGREIYYTDKIAHAEHFFLHVEKLEANRFYHKFPSVLELMVKNLIRKVVVAETVYTIVDDE